MEQASNSRPTTTPHTRSLKGPSDHLSATPIDCMCLCSLVLSPDKYIGDHRGPRSGAGKAGLDLAPRKAALMHQWHDVATLVHVKIPVQMSAKLRRTAF